MTVQVLYGYNPNLLEIVTEDTLILAEPIQSPWEMAQEFIQNFQTPSVTPVILPLMECSPEDIFQRIAALTRWSDIEELED